MCLPLIVLLVCFVLFCVMNNSLSRHSFGGPIPGHFSNVQFLLVFSNCGAFLQYPFIFEHKFNVEHFIGMKCEGIWKGEIEALTFSSNAILSSMTFLRVKDMTYKT